MLILPQNVIKVNKNLSKIYFCNLFAINVVIVYNKCIKICIFKRKFVKEEAKL